MSPAFVPTIKELLRHLTRERSETILKQVLKFRTNAQIARYWPSNYSRFRRSWRSWTRSRQLKGARTSPTSTPARHCARMNFVHRGLQQIAHRQRLAASVAIREVHQ